MGKVYITNENGAQSEYSELRALDLVQQGLISRRARYWKEGMSESRPVSELVDELKFVAEETPEESGGFVEGVVARVRDWLERFKR